MIWFPCSRWRVLYCSRRSMSLHKYRKEFISHHFFVSNLEEYTMVTPIYASTLFCLPTSMIPSRSVRDQNWSGKPRPLTDKYVRHSESSLAECFYDMLHDGCRSILIIIKFKRSIDVCETSKVSWCYKHLNISFNQGSDDCVRVVPKIPENNSWLLLSEWQPINDPFDRADDRIRLS